jgi:hypothetical protein
MNSKTTNPLNAMIPPKIRPNTTTRTSYRSIAMGLIALIGVVGLAACSDDAKDVVSFIEYVGATADVLDANGLEPESEIDCDGSTDTNEVTCTGTTTGGLSIESTGENLGEDNATLIVMVDGKVLYDGLLDDAS